jgi:hypothetical protein
MSDRERERDYRDHWQEGPTGEAPTTETVGDPDSEDVESGAEGGAVTGALLGTAVAGPVGMVVGGAIGGAAGAAGEAADSDDDRGFERREEGTGPIDPIYEEKK